MLAPPGSLAQVYLAGFAAEHLATGRRPRQYDVETGLAILGHTDPTLVETFDGVQSSDGAGAVREVLRTGVRGVEEELRREVDRLYGVARESLSRVWPAVKAVAEVLLAREEIDGEGVKRAIGDADICGAVLAVQRGHGLLRPVPFAPAWTDPPEHACVRATVHEVTALAAQLSEEERGVVVEPCAAGQHQRRSSS